jgi:hypothetical protein
MKVDDHRAARLKSVQTETQQDVVFGYKCSVKSGIVMTAGEDCVWVKHTRQDGRVIERGKRHCYFPQDEALIFRQFSQLFNKYFALLICGSDLIHRQYMVH